MLGFLKNKNNTLSIFSQKIPAVLLVYLCAFAPINASAQITESPIVVELFTSKYCPACPAADKNINAIINQNPNIIAMSCHVSYFNRPGREDRLSAPFCDARQNVYKLALKTGKIFTPMTIINGRNLTTGKRMNDVQTLIKSTKRNINRPIGLKNSGGYIDIALPRIPLESPADIWLFEITQNPGQYIHQRSYAHYRNAVTKITKLMRWNGDPTNMAFPIAAKPGVKHALIIQNYKEGIIAAAQTR